MVRYIVTLRPSKNNMKESEFLKIYNKLKSVAKFAKSIGINHVELDTIPDDAEFLKFEIGSKNLIVYKDGSYKVEDKEKV